MTPSRRPSVVLALLAALAVAGASCGTGGGGGAGNGAQVSPAPPPRPGGTLTMAVREPAHIDPSRVSDNDKPGQRPGLLVVAQICDPLINVDPATGELKPGVAQSWSFSPDVKKLTVKIRPGFKFANGRDVTAADYVYSIQRFIQQDTGSALYFFFEKVAGYLEFRQKRAPELAGVRAPDPSTLEIELSEPFAEMPAVLTHPAAGAAVPREEVEKSADAFALSPVCNGPYKLASPWERGKDIRLVRSESYSGDDKGFADEMVFKVFESDEAGYQSFAKGLADIAEIPPERLPDARTRKITVKSRTNGLVSYLGFPVNKAPYDNADVRRALSLALDRQALVKDVLGGSRLAPGGFLPETAGPAAAEADCNIFRPEADPEGARRTLQTGGVDPAGLKPVVHFNNGTSGHRDWLEEVAGQWKSALGVEAALTPFDGDFIGYVNFLAEGKAEGPFRLAWPVDYPSPEALFGPQFFGGSLDNFSGFKNSNFDDLILKARATAAPSERQSLYAQAAQILCTEIPVAPVWFGLNHAGFAATLAALPETVLGVRGEPLLRKVGARI